MFIIDPYRFGSSVVPSTVETNIFNDGIWTWFNDPRSIVVSSSPQKIAVGGVSSTGRLLVFDEETSFSSVDLRGSTFQLDDHVNPALLLRDSDSKILVAACAHNGSGFYTYLSTNANDPTAFGAETNIDSQIGGSDYSYANIYQLPGIVNDPIYIFFRNDDDNYYTVSTDGGSTWATRVQFMSGNGDSANWSPYFKVTRNGDSRLDFFCTDGSPNATATNSIYHFYFDGTTFRETDGTALSLPILPNTDLTKVYDGTTNRAWIWDAAVDGSGNPVCVFAVFVSTTDHRYYRAKWNGSTWDVNEIVAGGGYLYASEAYYSGGVALDPDDVDTVFCSIGAAGGEAHRIWRYTTADGGSTWSGTQMTTAGYCFRPYVVRGATEPRLLYIFARDYTSFTNYDTDIILQDSTASGNVIPDAFTFTDVTGAAKSTVYTSNTITVAGLGAGVSVTIRVSSGEYRINGGSWTSTAGTVTNGDNVEVRVTSSASGVTAVSATLAIGARFDTYTVTTDVATDPNFSNVVFLPDFTGTDGATSATDDSNNALTISFAGNAQIDTGNANFPSGALLLDGSGDYVSMPDSAAWNISSSSGLYTIDVEFELSATTNLNNTTGQVIIGQSGGLGNFSWAIWPRSNNMIFWWWTASNGGGETRLEAAWTPATGQVYNVRVASDGTDVSLYVDGTRIATRAYTAPANGNNVCRIGSRTSAVASNFYGWIGSNTRVVIGEYLTDPNDASYTVGDGLPFPRS